MGPYRLLLIDDEPDIRIVAKACLELMGGFEVMVAGSSQEGLLCAEREQPDAILLDVMIPDIDGPAVVQRLQANPKTASIPVIFLTAKVRSPEDQDFMAIGVQAVIEKPFDPVMLAAQVAEILGWVSEE